MEKTKLTQTVQKGGCAAKIAASELRKILKQVNFPKSNPALLVDGSLFDDAAIYQVNAETALVQTLDFFTPILDSPYTFGKVAAANALSDVYAMGGEPKTAMAILAFPLATLEPEVIVEVMQGASDLLNEAGTPLVGGHSIDDDTLKFGLSVTGFVHPDRVWSNAKAEVGDKLILTKGIGTGTITAALKGGDITEDEMSDAITSMSTLNRVLDLLTSDEAHSIHAATDITGFGLLGHCMQMAKASDKTLNIQFNHLPILPLARKCLEEDWLTKAHRSNAQYVKEDVSLSGINKVDELLLYDPQTSGGLFLSVKASQADQVLNKLKNRFKMAAIVGSVSEASSHKVKVT